MDKCNSAPSTIERNPTHYIFQPHKTLSPGMKTCSFCWQGTYPFKAEVLQGLARLKCLWKSNGWSFCERLAMNFLSLHWNWNHVLFNAFFFWNVGLILVVLAHVPRKSHTGFSSCRQDKGTLASTKGNNFSRAALTSSCNRFPSCSFWLLGRTSEMLLVLKNKSPHQNIQTPLQIIIIDFSLLLQCQLLPTFHSSLRLFAGKAAAKALS